MQKAVYPGTFDPVTYGHIDLIERGAKIFNQLIVTVGENPQKQPLFSLEERIAMLEEVVADYRNVKVDRFEGLIVDYLKRMDLHVILRGIRTLSDFDYEFQMALTNRELAPDIETVYVMTSQEYSFLHSNLIKEIARFGGDVSSFVPKNVERMFKQKFAQ